MALTTAQTYWQSLLGGVATQGVSGINAVLNAGVLQQPATRSAFVVESAALLDQLIGAPDVSPAAVADVAASGFRLVLPVEKDSTADEMARNIATRFREIGDSPGTSAALLARAVEVRRKRGDIYTEQNAPLIFLQGALFYRALTAAVYGENFGRRTAPERAFAFPVLAASLVEAIHRYFERTGQAELQAETAVLGLLLERSVSEDALEVSIDIFNRVPEEDYRSIVTALRASGGAWAIAAAPSAEQPSIETAPESGMPAVDVSPLATREWLRLIEDGSPQLFARYIQGHLKHRVYASDIAYNLEQAVRGDDRQLANEAIKYLIIGAGRVKSNNLYIKTLLSTLHTDHGECFSDEHRALEAAYAAAAGRASTNAALASSRRGGIRDK